MSVEGMPLVGPCRGQAGVSAIAGPFGLGFPLLQPARNPRYAPLPAPKEAKTAAGSPGAFLLFVTLLGPWPAPLV